MNDTIIEITGNGVDIHIPLEKKIVIALENMEINAGYYLWHDIEIYLKQLKKVLEKKGGK
jgi:hypothetical protein|tara:strand:+ start:191 stop:370 length:180 start_codon:yes stop_codon:yes gene_type:complete